MKRISILTVFIATLLHFGVATAQQNDSKRQLSAIFSFSTFYEASLGSYMETYLSFDAWSLVFAKQGDQYQATVEILVTISKNDSIEIAKKYDLNSPKIASPDNDHFNFIDMQRYALPNGIHDISITLRDKNSANPATEVKGQVPLYYDRKHPALSSIQLMTNVKPTTTPNIMSRSGYDMEPYVNDFLPEQVSLINYYCELYNINREVPHANVYAVSFIEIQETGKVLEETQTTQRLERDSIIPIFGTLDISMVPSGNYNLVVEIRDRNNDKFLYKRIPFFRSNPRIENQIMDTPVETTFAGRITDETKLNDYVEALYPLANEIERREIYRLINTPGLKEKQEFLYHFWVRRNALEAESHWAEYRQRVDYVNANFGWIHTKGIQTDRGRVYLQYGPPDYVRDEKNFVSVRGMGSGVTIARSSVESERAIGLDDEVRSGQGQVFYLPYQLWRYNRLEGDDANRCFIFWDEFRSGHYKLLHSNAKGEVRDLSWERRLCQGQLPDEAVGEVGEQFQRGH